MSTRTIIMCGRITDHFEVIEIFFYTFIFLYATRARPQPQSSRFFRAQSCLIVA